jgi:hypothetical protein
VSLLAQFCRKGLHVTSHHHQLLLKAHQSRLRLVYILIGGCKGGSQVFFSFTLSSRSQVSSGSIVSDYGLDDRAIGVQSPAGAKDFSSILCVQTGSGAHPASCPMCTRVLSLGVKHGRGVTLTTHPHLVQRS